MEVVRHLPNDPFMVAVGSSQYAIGFTKAGRPMKPHFPLPVPLQAAWYSRIWQTKPNPYSPRMYLGLVRGHFELMGWL